MDRTETVPHIVHTEYGELTVFAPPDTNIEYRDGVIHTSVTTVRSPQITVDAGILDEAIPKRKQRKSSKSESLLQNAYRKRSGIIFPMHGMRNMILNTVNRMNAAPALFTPGELEGMRKLAELVEPFSWSSWEKVKQQLTDFELPK